ncbi:hypothetical protein [Neobacillus niacini]
MIKKSNSDYEFKSKCNGFLMRNGFESNTINIAIYFYLEK